jgi:hypothetical protein
MLDGLDVLVDGTNGTAMSFKVINKGFEPRAEGIASYADTR